MTRPSPHPINPQKTVTPEHRASSSDMPVEAS